MQPTHPLRPRPWVHVPGALSHLAAAPPFPRERGDGSPSHGDGVRAPSLPVGRPGLVVEHPAILSSEARWKPGGQPEGWRAGLKRLAGASALVLGFLGLSLACAYYVLHCYGFY